MRIQPRFSPSVPSSAQRLDNSQPSTLNSQPASAPTPRLSAFTLIEFIGVLAVLAILAALTVPSVLRQIDEAAYTRERTDLAGISNSLVLNILSTRTIPTATNMPQAVADWTRVPVGKITTGPRGRQRVFVVDRGGWLTNTLTANWTQPATGAAQPNRSRILILSSSSGTFPALIDGGNFQQIWDLPELTRPAGWALSLGSHKDLLVQRMNLDPLFHQLVMVNRDPPGQASFAINSASTVGLTNVQKGFYLNGTDLGLYSGSTPMPQMRALLEEDRSFVFQGGRWTGQLEPGGGYSDVVGSEFAAVAAKFLATEWYAGSHKGGNQQGAIVAMFNFMLTYQLWADQCPHFPTRGEMRNNVPEYLLMLDMAGQGVSSLLNSFTGSDGLLK